MLKYTILLLTYCGLWQPTDWITGWKTYLYTIYTYLVILLLSTCTLLELLYLVTSTDEVAEIARNSFVLLSMIGACAKAINLFKKKSVIFDMMVLLEKDPYQPKINPKNIILNKYNDIINKSSLSYIIMNEVTMIIMIITMSIKSIPNRLLTTNIWVPYDYTTPIGFWSAYIFQLIAHAYGASINTACDTLIPSMMYQICCQFSILGHRFEILPDDVMGNITKCDKKKSILIETIKLGECVEHHLQIYQWAERCNNIFSGIIFLQYSISSIILCVSVILLTQIEYNDPNFPSTILYLICMFFQIFILCYLGNQVTIESIYIGDVIYSIDCTQFQLSTKKHLMMIMKRTMHPIKFTSGHFVTLSIDSFTDLIKLSYSVFNLISRSSG